ncbi:nicotinamide riboside transporter PnuC [Amphritea sp. 1_MG-2023]|uniref:nicotinamide riboside transporter PnuC n=1 Tax=Amphritea sp. 1_MG-2023 TaxID=3062670 RepID=UPI0026E2DB5F|nr:nicotinamide riboside transporter PnuC [Amphritea sp. 1_MG-2023]MDO6563615.1 nicotinamide riboside transporter PnuC [Amphritea sp. 1_MG-2023]
MLMTFEWLQLLGTTPLEITATVSAILGVVLIARQNMLGWPLGILWASISAWLAITEWQLVSDGILYLAYIPIQLYCWRAWIIGNSVSSVAFIPTWLSRQRQLALLAAVVLCIVAWGQGIAALATQVSWIPQPSLLWLDAITTVLSFFAQFLQARKRMENWVFWSIVNVLGIYIYWLKDAPIYSVQYAIFLLLGLYGWLQWHRSLKQAARVVNH